MSKVRFSLQSHWMPEAWYPDLAVESERLGFDVFWVGDHVAAPIEYEPRYPFGTTGRPTMRPETPLPDVFAVLAAAAMRTDRIRVGTNVTVLPMRPLLLTARSAATVQNLSGGRFVLGVGIGWQREEFEAIGMPFTRRGARTDDMLELLPKLWTGEVVEHDGLAASFGPLMLSPGVCAPIPIMGSGHSAAGLRRSARLNGWCGPPGPSLEENLQIRDRLLAEREAVGRLDEPFQMWFRPGHGSAEEIAAYVEAGFEHLTLTPAYGGTPDTLEEALEGIRSAAVTALPAAVV